MSHSVMVRSTSPHKRMFQTANPDDVGFDLPIHLEGIPSMNILNHSRKDLPTGIYILLPPDIGARIISRSSTFFTYGLEVYEGLIDPGYTGELRVMVMNRSGEMVRVHDGQRIAQVVFFPVIRPVLIEVAEFPPTARGTKGFGSTGK